MTDTAFIELNDSGIILADNSGPRVCEPGYAWLAATGVRTGNEARRHAFLEPQRVYHQFWQQLSLAPLSNASAHARHHADLAYNQLLHLHRAGGEPEQAIFAVPGTFSREQLAILLGLVEAAPFAAVGLVDSAVAALSSFAERGEWLHIDLHLHQAVLTHVRITNRVERKQVSSIAGAGLKTLLDNWAQHIAHLFIRQYRYDPMHTAAGEQQLYDGMEQWLRRLIEEPEITVELESQRGTYSLNLPRESIIESNHTLFERIALIPSGWSVPSTNVILSDRLASIPGASSFLGSQFVLPPDATVRGIQDRREQFSPGPGGLILHTALERPTAPPPPLPDTATDSPAGRHPHLLHGYRAYRLTTPLYLTIESDQLLLGNTKPAPPWLKLQVNGGAVDLQTEGTLNVEAIPPLRPGSTFTVHHPGTGQRHELVIIEAD